MFLINKVLPKRLTGQLMLLVVLALIAAQMVNLFILVDTNQLRARENIVISAVDILVEQITEIRQSKEGFQPHTPIRGGPIRSAFLSTKSSQASYLDPHKELKSYRQLVSETLADNGVNYRSFALVVGRLKDHKPGLKNRPEDQQQSLIIRRPRSHGPHPDGPHPNRLNLGGPHASSSQLESNIGGDQNLQVPTKLDELDSTNAEPTQNTSFEKKLGPSARERRHPGANRKGGKRPHGPPRLNVPEPMNEVLILSVELTENQWANVIFPHESIEALTPRIMLATAALLLITLLSVGFFIRKLITPLSELTNATEEFGRGAKPVELSETGPQDIRRAAQAFNRMQRRLGRTLETQQNMLQAVGHDLRTPLTSLRIRSEMIPEEPLRDKFIDTIDEMTALTEEILGWAKNLSGLEAVSSIDLAAFINSVVDDYADQGENVSTAELPAATVRVRRMAFKRAVQNVVSNALKYGDSARISVSETASHYEIHVDDEGPGIPEEKFAEAIEPFVRLESSRNRHTGGTGLGLSITETILHTEGGKLSLSNRQTLNEAQVEGLRVTLSILKPS